MKAIINGITIEGTPQELADYQKIMDDMRRDGVHIKPPLGKPPQWVAMGDPTIYGPKKCTYPCNCTGLCHGSSLYKMAESFNALNNYARKSGETAP